MVSRNSSLILFAFIASAAGSGGDLLALGHFSVSETPLLLVSWHQRRNFTIDSFPVLLHRYLYHFISVDNKTRSVGGSGAYLPAKDPQTSSRKGVATSNGFHRYTWISFAN
jgi:hypothetical protein